MVRKIKKKIKSMYQKKCWEEKQADLLLTGEGEKEHYDLVNDFNRFMYDHSLHHGFSNDKVVSFTKIEYDSLVYSS